MKSYSQHNQDINVLKYFNNKRDGFFLDIGAHDGQTLSNTYLLEKEFGWKGICFEPMPHQFARLDECRTSLNINAAVFNKEGIENFTLVDYDGYPDMLSGISSEISFRHMGNLISEGSRMKAPLRTIKVKTVILNDILEDQGISEIDFVSLDTEGAELSIVQSMDHHKFHFKLFAIENGNSDPEIRNYMTSQGYKMLGRWAIDDVFIKH
jgi:FkbM family methyltransferase